MAWPAELDRPLLLPWAQSPASATRSLRDIHGAIGMDCTHCHGHMEDLALGLLRHEQQAGKSQASRLMTRLRPRSSATVEQIVPRSPWVQQPDCLYCHVIFQPPDSDRIAHTWTTGEQALYRNRTDDSGRLACAACHSSPHALYPAFNPRGVQLDALQPLQYQRNRLPLGANRNCAVCHTVAMEDELHHPNSLRDMRNE